MDVVMPGMNGFQATRKLNKDPTTANIPVIIITTKAQETDKIWGMRQGAVEYIVKPVAEKQLVSMINTVMAA
jgi:twitching motility two-component system response regulator PilH